uniref:Uncharacterized protein n=1 Tax=Rhizophora mucronata TaxID=61149 RepID=A0A2P2QB57_RHIMU
MGIKRAVLYDGSITDFDCHLCRFDIGTCLEVIYFLIWCNVDIQPMFGPCSI